MTFERTASERSVESPGEAERDGLGTSIRAVLPSGRSLVRHATSAVGYGGSNDKRVHFGLGAEDRIQRLEVTWPGGRRHVRENVAADRVVEVVESTDTGQP